MSAEQIEIKKIDGTAVVVRGNDIDTDRIIPARYMKEITFDNMGEHVFADARSQAKDAGGVHPFDDERFAGAKVLVVNKGFGSGSSREHAPQALMRWGISAIVGESYAEIFFGNCTALGIPCVTLPGDQIEALMEAIEAEPKREVSVDIDNQKVVCGDVSYDAGIPAGTRQALLEGTWDATAQLLAAKDDIEKTLTDLPYISNFN